MGCERISRRGWRCATNTPSLVRSAGIHPGSHLIKDSPSEKSGGLADVIQTMKRNVVVKGYLSLAQQDISLAVVVNMVKVHQKQQSKSAPLGRHDASDIEAGARDSLPLSR